MNEENFTKFILKVYVVLFIILMVTNIYFPRQAEAKPRGTNQKFVVEIDKDISLEEGYY